MVKKLIHKINVRYNDHLDHIEVRRRLVTYSDNISAL